MDVVIANRSRGIALRSSARTLPTCARVAGAGLLGSTWTAAPSCAVLASLLLVLWWRAGSRLEAAALGGAYQLGATHGLAAGAGAYLNVSGAEGVSAIVVLALFVSAPWALCWVPASSTSVRARALCFGAWLVLTVCPVAFGAALVAHPIMVAGWWFPGSGWFGLGMSIALLFGTFTRLGAGLVLALSAWSILVGWSDPEPIADPTVEAVTTRSEPALGELDFAGHFRVAQEALEAAVLSDAPVVVLPEGSAGAWTGPMRALWAPYARALGGRRMVIGASTRDAQQLNNSAVILGGRDDVIVPQRVPIPVAMWRPWASGGFAAHPWSAGTAELGGRKAGFIVCWEGALVLPALLSIADGAELLVHLANHAWVGSAGLPTVVATRAFGALFGIPVAIARNAQGGDDA